MACRGKPSPLRKGFGTTFCCLPKNAAKGSFGTLCNAIHSHVGSTITVSGKYFNIRSPLPILAKMELAETRFTLPHETNTGQNIWNKFSRHWTVSRIGSPRAGKQRWALWLPQPWLERLHRCQFGEGKLKYSAVDTLSCGVGLRVWKIRAARMCSSEHWRGESSAQRTLQTSGESPLCIPLTNHRCAYVQKLHEAGERNTQTD